VSPRAGSGHGLWRWLLLESIVFPANDASSAAWLAGWALFFFFFCFFLSYPRQRLARRYRSGGHERLIRAREEMRETAWECHMVWRLHALYTA
jgi:hypothetical protein